MAAMLAHNLKNRYRVKDWLIPNTCFRISDGTRSTMKKKKKKNQKEKKKKKKQQRSEANHIYLNAAHRSKFSRISLINTVPRGDQIQSLWVRNYGRQGMELSAEPCSRPASFVLVDFICLSRSLLSTAQLWPALYGPTVASFIRPNCGQLCMAQPWPACMA